MSRDSCGLKDVHEMPEHRVALLLRLRRELKERLAEFAKHEHRSLNQQIEFILEQFLSKGRIEGVEAQAHIGTSQ
jgi:hypothetical protein